MISGNIGYELKGRLDFRGGWYVKKFLKPGEGGVAIVSEPLEFSLRDQYEGGHAGARFMQEFELLLKGRAYSSDKLSANTLPISKDAFRLAISCAAPPNRISENVEGQPEMVWLPVKVKLLSDIALQAPRAERKLRCLAQLARICGVENLVITIVNFTAVADYEDNLLELCWNEVDLCWEADGKMQFKRSELSKFGTAEGRFKILLEQIRFYLNKQGTVNVLQRLYGKCGQNWKIQQQFLEAEQFTDLEILGSGSNPTPIKCHKIYLAGASPVFGAMLSGSWEEGKTGIIKLPESEDAVRAMLHFLYYGGTERILAKREDILLELLEAGHKYEIPTLVDVTAFIVNILADCESEENWFTADGAVKLFHFARHLEGRVWTGLKKQSFEVFQRDAVERKKTSAGVQQMFEIADKLGPVFSWMLSCYGNWTPSVPNDKLNVSQEDAALFYDFVSCGRDYEDPRNLDVALGLMILAEFCGRPVPRYYRKSGSCVIEIPLKYQHVRDVDYIVDLYYFAKKKQKEAGYLMWNWELEMATVECLKKLKAHQPAKVMASKKYLKLVKRNPTRF